MTTGPTVTVTVRVEIVDDERHRVALIERHAGQELDDLPTPGDVTDAYRGSLAIAAEYVSTMLTAGHGVTHTTEHDPECSPTCRCRG